MAELIDNHDWSWNVDVSRQEKPMGARQTVKNRIRLHSSTNIVFWR